jgi:DegV family protein with EDD domain
MITIETVIITDSCSDLPLRYVEENNIPVLGLTCHFKGGDYEDDFGKTLGYGEFYAAVRSGEMPTTSQINSYRFAQEFKKYASQGKAVIYIGFSSALSGSVDSARSAREMAIEEYKDADITIIDSKSASLGQGLLVYYAYEMLKNRRPKDEIIDWVENNKLKLNHWFTVSDLAHLKRGGRISAAASAIGTILDIKPLKADEKPM